MRPQAWRGIKFTRVGEIGCDVLACVAGLGFTHQGEIRGAECGQQLVAIVRGPLIFSAVTRSDKELLMVYAGILAHGTSMSAAETARMMPQLSAANVRQAMRWAGDERRLAEASAAVLGYLRRHPISATWGRSDLASSDMMSLETRRRVWQARLDPRRQTPSVGIYSHVLAGRGIFNAQPIVLNERQVGVAIEGVLRQEEIEIVQLAVDTQRYVLYGHLGDEGVEARSPLA